MPSKNPSKKALPLENLLRTLLRSVRLHDPLGVRPSHPTSSSQKRGRNFKSPANQFMNPTRAPLGPPIYCRFGRLLWEKSRTKNQPKEEVFGTDIPRTSGGHSHGYPGPKLRSGRSKSWKNKYLGADIHDPKARTSTTLTDFQKSQHICQSV